MSFTYYIKESFKVLASVVIVVAMTAGIGLAAWSWLSESSEATATNYDCRTQPIGRYGEMDVCGEDEEASAAYDAYLENAAQEADEIRAQHDAERFEPDYEVFE